MENLQKEGPCVNNGRELAPNIQAATNNLLSPQGSKPPVKEWRLHARHLHFFWTFIYPKIVARIWCSGIKTKKLHQRNYGDFIINELKKFQTCAEIPKSKDCLQILIEAFGNMEIHLLPGHSFDYILCNKGLALPYVERPRGAGDIFRNYRDRPTSPARMNLPSMEDEFWQLGQDLKIQGQVNLDCKDSLKRAGEQKYGVEKLHILLKTVDWYIPGGLYSALVRATDRVIADAWYEETIREEVENKLKEQGTMNCDHIDALRKALRGNGSLLLKERLGDPEQAKKILSEYLEESLNGPLGNLPIRFIMNEQEAYPGKSVYRGRRPGFCEIIGYYGETKKMLKDARKANPDGLRIYLPPAPDEAQILQDMIRGDAGNPMYTQSVDTSGTF